MCAELTRRFVVYNTAGYLVPTPFALPAASPPNFSILKATATQHLPLHAKSPHIRVVSNGPTFHDRVLVKDIYNNYLRLLLSDILWLKGEGNYTRVVTSAKQYVLRVYLGDFLASLPADVFVRVHKSYGVNLRVVEAIRPRALVIHTQEVPLSKSYRDEILARFERY